MEALPMTMRPITSLYDFFEAFPDEQSAIDHLRAIRWKDGAFCPYCASKRVMHFSGIMAQTPRAAGARGSAQS
jgi:hypothetical protein